MIDTEPQKSLKDLHTQTLHPEWALGKQTRELLAKLESVSQTAGCGWVRNGNAQEWGLLGCLVLKDLTDGQRRLTPWRRTLGENC